jgi:hypothetical protein
MLLDMQPEGDGKLVDGDVLGGAGLGQAAVARFPAAILAQQDVAACAQFIGQADNGMSPAFKFLQAVGGDARNSVEHSAFP